MPRGPRLDFPGLLQHVIVRGIERGKVFLDDADREDFVRRLSGLLEQTKTECLAWCLVPNHLHLLLRPHGISLATFMRRLLTGYAVSFNLRHHRAGHLFQNRYKSIVCEEESYFLELVRYVGLNPLRARLVPTLEELDRYPWSGHAVLMGKAKMNGQAVEEVLGRFGGRVGEARKRCREFVAAGVSQGRRDELVGGGLKRSLAVQGEGRKPEAYDERVLGLGEFVERLRQDEELRQRLPLRISLEELLQRVSEQVSLEPAKILRRSTTQAVSMARGLVSCLAVAELGYKGTEVGAFFGWTRSGTSKAVERGRQTLMENPGLVEAILGRSPGKPAVAVDGRPPSGAAGSRE